MEDVFVKFNNVIQLNLTLYIVYAMMWYSEKELRGKWLQVKVQYFKIDL